MGCCAIKYSIRIKVAAFICGAAIFGAAVAQANPPPKVADAEALFPATAFLSQRETWAAFAVLVFGMLILLVATHLVRLKLLSGADTLRLVALVLIVTGTLFLVTAGYSAAQIAPALGLLGTIAGYLLGRSENARNEISDQGRSDPDDP